MDAKLSRASLSRAAGIAFGLGTQLLFVATVYFLFHFLRDGANSPGKYWQFVDGLLALQFAVVHSFLLLPAVRKRITRLLPGQLYGSLFAAATCAGLWIMFVAWQQSPTIIWNATGWPRTLILGAFYGSWIALVYSLHLGGLGYQTGWTQWLYWVRRQPLPMRPFQERGAYRRLRHPVYLSFLGLIWFTPRMSADHAVLTGIWTAYIFAGSYLKDLRLTYYLGDVYREYASRVAGYPGIFFGPLGKWAALESAPADEKSVQTVAVKRAA